MGVWSIVGYRRASDGLPGSWTPDVPEGIEFGSICGDTPLTVDRLRRGVDADSPVADPRRLAIVVTPIPFISLSRIDLGGELDDPLSKAGRFMVESFTRHAVGARATVRDGITAIVEAWDDNDNDKPDAIRPTLGGQMLVKAGREIVVSRPATRSEMRRRGS